LLYSLKKYVSGAEFNPDQTLPAGFISAMFKKPSLTTGARVLRCDSYETGNEPEKAIDNDLSSLWHTAYENPGNFAVTNKQVETDYPHEVQIELASETTFKGFVYHPRQDGQNGWVADYAFYVSSDGSDWGAPVIQGRLGQTDQPKEVLFPAVQKAKFVRFVALKGYDGQKWASMAELVLVGE
jgi:beta-galactosidase